MRNHVFKDLDFVLVYLDDIAILSKDFQQHQKHMNIVFERIKQFNLKLRLDKCTFGAKSIRYLGHTLSATCRKPDPNYIEKVLACTKPTDVKRLQSFLGLVNWLAHYIPGNSNNTQILYELLKTSKKTSTINLEPTSRHSI